MTDKFFKLDDLAKIALDDVRNRHKSLLDILIATDRQSMSMLSWTSSFSAAACAAFVSTIITDTYKYPAIQSSLLVLFIGFMSASYFAIDAMQVAKIGLPGRLGKYWKWAIEHNISIKETVIKYLEQAEQAHDLTAQTNNRAAKKLFYAKRSAAFTPFSP
jgi:hypothetical protein